MSIELTNANLISNVYDKILPDQNKFELVYTAPENFGYVLLDKTENTIYIPIRGTENPHDLVTDADIILHEHDGGKVVAGGLEQYYKLRAGFLKTFRFIRNNYDKFSADEFTINISGHSLGTWLAFELAKDIYFSTANNIVLNTMLFAPPNYCDHDYLNTLYKLCDKSFLDRIKSYAAIPDIIPKMPLGLHQVAPINFIVFNNVNHFNLPEQHEIKSYIQYFQEIENAKK